MNIGIIGAGNVGKTLGIGFIQAGHHVTISSRDPEHSKHCAWKQDAGGNGEIASYNEAARLGEAIVMALPWPCLRDVLETIDPVHLRNKTVIDVSNAVQFDNGPRLIHDNSSAGEQLQEWLPQSCVVKTLNTVNDKLMVHPCFKDGIPVMFVSGNDRNAKAAVTSLLRQLGWEHIVDLGNIRQSRLQESIMLACVLSEIRMQTTGAAFALLTH